jgi:hypothetical protein
MPETIFMKLGMYVVAPEPISTVYFINTSHQSVCLRVYTLIVATQRICKNVTAATNTYAVVEESLDASFSMRSTSYQKESRRLVLPRPFCFYLSSSFVTSVGGVFRCEVKNSWVHQTLLPNIANEVTFVHNLKAWILRKICESSRSAQ